jgi:transposase
MASLDNNFPLLHEFYPTNNYDSKQFIEIIDKIRLRVSMISNNSDDITLIFNKDNHLLKSITMLESNYATKLYFIGRLPLSQYPELLQIEQEQYKYLNGDAFGETSVFRTQKDIYAGKFTVIITDNPKLREAQLLDLNENILKCEKESILLQNNLKLREGGKIKRGQKRSLASVLKNARNILSAEHIKKVFSFSITETESNVALDFYLDKDNYVVNKYTFRSTSAGIVWPKLCQTLRNLKASLKTPKHKEENHERY